MPIIRLCDKIPKHLLREYERSPVTGCTCDVCDILREKGNLDKDLP